MKILTLKAMHSAIWARLLIIIGKDFERNIKLNYLFPFANYARDSLKFVS